MIKRTVVLTIAVGLCASIACGAISASNDVNPSDVSGWTSSTGVYIGENGQGSVTINGGSDLIMGNAYLGRNSGSRGVVTVSGADSTWTNSRYLFVGSKGDGEFVITDGALASGDWGSSIASGSNSTGTVLVNGAGSTWANSSSLTVGSGGFGTLDIINGGSVISRSGRIADARDSRGEVTVSGVGSIWTSSGGDYDYFYVGYSGQGSLDITNGGSVNTPRAYISRYSHSTGAVTVSGAGSSWISSDLLYVSYENVGTMDITNGGLVSCTEGYIAYGANSTGAATVSGASSTWTNSSDLYVGNMGAGVLNISGGGLVEVTGEIHLSMNAGSTGVSPVGSYVSLAVSRKS
jgi:T5SS/PEP-CTERM-associated repeat protein